MTLGERIKYFREQKNITQAQLASITGLHPVSIRKYEVNKMNPQFAQVEIIADALGVSPNALMGLENSNLRLETVGDFMGILYMLLDTNHLEIVGKRGQDEFLNPSTISLSIKDPLILSELIKWEKMNEMYKRVVNGNDGTSEDIRNALIERMQELKEGVSLESQRSSVLLNKQKKK